MEVERTLSRLSPPAPARVSAASVLLEAKLRRRGRQVWAWRAVAAVLGVALGAQFFERRGPEGSAPTKPVVPISVVVEPARQFPAQFYPLALPVDGGEYISVRNRMIAFEAPPPARPVSESAPPPKMLRRPSTPSESPAPSLLELLFTKEPVHS